MDIIQIIEDKARKIKNQVAIANFEQAVKLLIDLAREHHLPSVNDAISVSSGFYALKKQVIDGTEYRDTIDVRNSRNTKAILAAVDDIKAKAIAAAKEKPSETRTEIDKKIILQATNIEKDYRSTQFHFELEKLTLRLGEITGLVGENATGKTTLLRILAGDLAHDKGKLQYPEFNKSKRLWWHRIKRHIAYVPQELSVWNGGLEQNLAYRAAQRGIKGADNRRETEYIIHRLGLVEHIGKSWRQLSGGYKLRFALAGALVCRPQLLIIDEPLANLDVNTQVIVLDDLRKLAGSLRHPLSIIISSQHIHEIEAVADQMFFMRGGKTEHLGYLRDYRSQRDHNIYELHCADPNRLPAALAALQGIRLQQNSMAHIITTPTTLTAQDLLQALHRQDIRIHYFRDISQSVKTKFYEKTT